MAEDFVSFDNKFLQMVNPLPKVTMAEVYKKAGVTLRNRKRAQEPAFPLELRWGGGSDLKTHTLLPGNSLRMPEKIGREVAEAFKPVGGFCGTEPGLASFADDKERREAILRALDVAEQHYHNCGAGQIDEVRQFRGHRDDEVEERYRDSIYSTYHVAIAKEQLIREERERLESAPAKG